MEQKKHTTRHRPSSDGPPTGPAATGATGVASLREQARGFDTAARVAIDNCEKGLDAVTELSKRGNKTGE